MRALLDDYVVSSRVEVLEKLDDFSFLDIIDIKDDGKVEVEPLLFFDLDGKDYIALVPTDEEAEDVYFFIYHDLDDEEFEFLDIEDDAEFDRVVAEFERLIGETEGSDE